MQVTIDELRMYSFCGRYFESYTDKTKDIELYNPMSPDHNLYYGLWRWLCYEFLMSKYVPSEVMMLAKAKEIKKVLESKGRVIMFSDMNRITHNVLTMRSLLLEVINSSDPITSLCQHKTLLLNKIEVGFFEILKTKQVLYLFNPYQSLAEFFESVDLASFLYLYSTDLPKWIHVIHLEDSRSISVKVYQTKRNFDPTRSYEFLDSLTKGLRSKVALPIYNCKNFSCSNFQDCTSNKKILKGDS